MSASLSVSKVESARQFSSEPLLSSFIDSHRHYVMRLDTCGYLKFINRSFLNKFRYQRKELLGHNFSELLSREELSLWHKRLNKCIHHPRRLFAFTQARSIAGGITSRTRWELTGIAGTDSRVVEIHGFGHDIPEPKKTEEKLKVNDMSLKALINNIKSMIWSVDSNYHLLYANRTFESYLNGRSGGCADSTAPVFLCKTGDHPAGTWKSFYDKALSGERFTVEYDLSSVSHKESWNAEICFSPVTNYQDKIIGVGCCAQDITQRLNFQNQVLDREKTLKEITAIASHEIRGPVASMLGLFSLIDKSSIKNKPDLFICDYLEKALVQLDSVIHLIVNKSVQMD